MDYNEYLNHQKLLSIRFNNTWSPQQLFANKCNDPAYFFLRRFEKEHGFKRMLDLACGYATLSYHLKNRDRIIGVDISQDTLDKVTHIMTQQADAHNLPFEDNTFDLVVIDGSMEFFLRPLVVLKECKRVMTYGGTLYITNVRDNLGLGLGLTSNWDVRAFEEMLRICGFDFIRKIGFDCNHISYVCRRRKIKWC